ncbi:MAG: hypothetical protein AAF747_05990 [Planctomycetota bacterium]
MCITRGIVRTAVVGGTLLAVVGIPAAVVAGPDRVSALFNTAADKVNQTIDAAVGDPAAIRAQLKELEAEYPERIAEVASDVQQIETQIGQLEREQAVTDRVIAMSQQDMLGLRDMIARGHDAQIANGGSVVRIAFNDRRVSLADAQAELSRIENVNRVYASKSQDLSRDLNLLTQQRDRLSGLLTKLRTEQSEFQAKLWQLDRQVDAIARNDRMIELFEERQASIDKLGGYEAKSLDQVETRIARELADQQARLETLASGGAERGSPGWYEAEAKAELDVLLRSGAEYEANLLEIEPAPVIDRNEIVIGDEPDAGIASRDF